MQDNITIIILIFEEETKVITSCLNKLKNYKIIIIDNSNNLQRKQIILDNFKIEKFFLNKNNLGFGKAINIGINNCDTDFFLILNPDCLIKSDAIKKLYDTLIKYKDCLITTPTLLTKEGEVAQNSSRFPELESIKTPIKIEGDFCCQSVLAAAILCRKKDIVDLGMFDENFFLFYEDDDICKRIYLKKKSVIQVFDAEAIHQHGEAKSIKNSIKRTFIINYNMTYSELYYFYKINDFQDKLNSLKKKIPNYTIKFILNIILLKFNKSTFFFSKVLAYYKFKIKISGNRIL